MGYGDAPGRCNIPNDGVIMKYDVRMVLERLLVGYVRNYFYQFADQPNDSVYGAYGLVRADATAKPQYTAIKSMIGLLGGTQSTAPGSLHYSLSKTISNVHHLLMQKGDGSYVLALWQEVPSWDPNAQTVLAVAPQSATLTLNARSVVEYTYKSNGTLGSRALAASNGVYPVSVTDAVTFLQIKP